MFRTLPILIALSACSPLERALLDGDGQPTEVAREIADGSDAFIERMEAGADAQFALRNGERLDAIDAAIEEEAASGSEDPAALLHAEAQLAAARGELSALTRAPWDVAATHVVERVEELELETSS